MLSRWIIRLSFLLTALSTLSACGYNDIQGADETTKSAWSEVLNQYQRRADLIPNLVNTVPPARGVRKLSAAEVGCQFP